MVADASGSPPGESTGPPAPSSARLIVALLVAAAVLGGAFALARSRSDQRDAVVRAEAVANVDDAPDAATTPVDAPAAPAEATSESGAAALDAQTLAPPSTPTPAELTLAFSGDVLPHSPLNNQAAAYGTDSGRAYDYGPMFAPMQGVLDEADAAICHMEVPLAPTGEAVTSYPSFGAPAELVDDLRRAGYEGCSTSSNHSLDRGQDGIRTTLDRFDLNDLRHTGTARSQEEADTVTTYEVAGAKVAHLSYAYDFNGYRIPDDAPFSVNQIDPGRVAADAARARDQDADLVVVSLHWGTEYDSEPSAYQRDIAERLLPSSDIDLVIGHHAHVVQPIDQIDGTYVVWGLGNQLSNQTQDPRRDGLTVLATATRSDDGWSFTGIEAVPTFVDLDTFEVLPVTEVLADPDVLPGLRDQLSASYDRTATILLGGRAPGVILDPKP